MADENSVVSRLTSAVKKLSQSKATGGDLAKIKDIQKKVIVFIGTLKAKVDGQGKIQKEIDDFKAKKKALISKLDAYNKLMPKLHDDAMAAIGPVNDARGKVSKEDQTAITELWNTLNTYTSVPPSLKLDD
jgi:hypothetical protein